MAADMDTTRQPKDTRVLALMSLMLLCPSVVFAVTGDAPQTLFLVAGGLAGSWMLRRPLPRTARSFIYAGLSAALAMVMQDQLMPVDGKRFFLIPAEIYCPGVLFAGVAATYFDQKDTNVTAVIALSLVALMLAGNVVGVNLDGRRLPVLFHSNEATHLFYGCAVAFEILVMLFLLPNAQHRNIKPGTPGSHRLLRTSVILVLYLVAGFSAFQLRRLALHYESDLQHVFAYVLRAYMMRRQGSVVFGEEVDLWRTVPSKTNADKKVVIRAVSEKAPGYLRGFAYTGYAEGRWGVRREAGSVPFSEPDDERLTYSVFRRRGVSSSNSAAGRRVDILPSGGFSSPVLLAPGRAGEVEVIAAAMTDSRDGVLTPTDWESDTGYTVVLTPDGQGEAYPGPVVSEGREASYYLTVPPGLRESLEPVVREAFAGVPEDAPAANQAAALVAFFRANFEYSLGTRMRDTPDPVVQFLGTRRGHCELFATAAALLMRMRGVPARYVTGFVCAEKPFSAGYWIARLEDAHAWTEVFDRDRGQWVLLEATPAIGVPSDDNDLGVVGTVTDRLALWWQRMLVTMKRGHVARAIVALVGALLTGAERVFGNAVGGTAAGIVAALVAAWFIRRRLRALAGRSPEARIRYRLTRTFLRLERGCGRLGVRRDPGSTVRELAAHVSRVEEPDFRSGESLAEMLREYEALRFGAAVPEEEKVVSLERRARAGVTVWALPRRKPGRNATT